MPPVWQGHSFCIGLATILGRYTGYEHHCTVVLVTVYLPKYVFWGTAVSRQIAGVRQCSCKLPKHGEEQHATHHDYFALAGMQSIWQGLAALRPRRKRYSRRLQDDYRTTTGQPTGQLQDNSFLTTNWRLRSKRMIVYILFLERPLAAFAVKNELSCSCPAGCPVVVL